MKRIGDILTRNKAPVTRLGDHIREESHPVGKAAAKFHLVGVSNELGLVPSPRESAADDLSRYQRVQRDWFAYNPMRVNVGSIGLADDDSKTGITSPDYTVFSCRDSLDTRYLLHFLKSDYGLEAIAQQCSGAVRKRLYYSGLAEIKLPIPPIQRQREVVAHIESIQNAVTFIRHELVRDQTLAKLKQAILQEAIQGKLTADWRAAHPDVEPASLLLHRIQVEKARLIAAKKLRPEKPLPKITPAEIPFEIPKGWEWCRLGSISTATIGLIYKPEQVGEVGVPVLRANSIVGSEITLDGLIRVNATVPDTKMAEIGDILVCVRSGSKALIGKCAVIKESGFSFGAFMTLLRSEFNPYLFRFLLSDAFRSQIDDQKSTGINQLTQSTLNNVVIPLPPLAEQAAIVERVEALMTTCRALEAEIEHARTHAAHLLQAVLKEAFAPAS